LVVSAQRYTYDPASDTLFDAQENVTCPVEGGNFVCPGGKRLDPGWRITVGTENFGRILRDQRLRSPFLGVFAWNIIFAGLSVVFTFAAGLFLANALQDERIRGRAFYRSILIIPYAIPGFISILIWRGLLNDQFGQVNRLIEGLGLSGLPWLEDGLWAKVAILLVNTWLGFPYMFLICLGALQAIPSDLKEAARVDGAGPGRVFRSITLPLLLVSTSPLLIGSFAFNFNNFVLIFLLTGGGPPLVGVDVPRGATDILISFTFKIALQSGRGQNFGLGSAIVIVIFVMVALLSALSFRWTKRLEDVYGNA
jgi:arabinogalactan oligomer/maltooligosaccharide transport system permease protein